MPYIIPVFIPHEGCPHCCIFCNQHHISGQAAKDLVSPFQVHQTIAEWLGRRSGKSAPEVQVAFYGGSFTGLPRGRQEELLDAAYTFVKQGDVHTIRLSTRPDYIDRQALSLLQGKGVGIVELGVQSLDNLVLGASSRGHTARQATEAVAQLKKQGFRVGVQIMAGLPLQTTRSLMKTVRLVARLEPDFVRIYPVLVLEGSGLAALYAQGRYRPLSLDQAVATTVMAKKVLDKHGVKVIRMGLQAGRDLEKHLVAGPYHPAFGEMVNGRIMFRQARKLLAGLEKNSSRVILAVNEKDLSAFRGVKSQNMKRLEALDLLDRFTLTTDSSLPRLSVKMQLTMNP